MLDSERKFKIKVMLCWTVFEIVCLRKQLCAFKEFCIETRLPNIFRLLLKEMSAKSLKFFGPPTTKWRPCKIFGKLNGNHLLMANIFKLHEYQTFGLMKMHNMCKI